LQLKLIPNSKKLGGWATTKRMVYDGTFTLDIDNPTQPDVFVDSRQKRVVLTHVKGHRRATILFLFDLPSGAEYEAISRFTAG
ncbi:MAG: hypothetical protein ACRD1T_21545, partial [Acidimicrobiia bacterium]